MANNIQFNATSAKDFRNTMAKWHVAKNKVADYANRRADELKAAKSILENSQADLDAINAGTYEGMRKAEDVQADIDAMKARVETVRKDYEDAYKNVEKNLQTAMSLVKNENAIYKAYEACAKAHFADDKYADFNEAVAEFFRNNGLSDATAENVSRYTRAIGAKRLSAKQSFKAKSITGAKSTSDFIQTFLGNLADILAEDGVITPSKYGYTPVSLREKKNK